MQNDIYIQGGRLIDPSTGRNEIADLYIREGLIAELPPQVPSGARLLTASGRVVVPGLIDVHVHLREPGNEAAETIDTGSRAAARGGFTTVVAMPNTTPPMDSPALITQVLEAGRTCGWVNVLPSGCLTRGRKGGVVADIVEMARAGAVAFTDDGATVTSDPVMKQAMALCRDLNMPVMDHALDPALAGPGVMHEGSKSRQLGLPGIPSDAETRIVERDIRLAAETGCAVHIQHLSAAGSIDLIRKAVARGTRISAEATPHHLALTDDDVVAGNADFKMNPPVRSVADRSALLAAVADGTIQILATDHAPHTRQDKDRGFLSAPFGVVGLETAIGVTYTLLVKSGMMSVVDWLRRWTTGPAGILERPAPGLAPGQPADLAILDLDSEWTVNPAGFASKSRNTPFTGRTFTGRAIHSLKAGKLTWSL